MDDITITFEYTCRVCAIKETVKRPVFRDALPQVATLPANWTDLRAFNMGLSCPLHKAQLFVRIDGREINTAG